MQRFQELHTSIILYVKSHSIPSAAPLLPVLTGGPENAVAESDSTLLSCRGVWEHLQVCRRTGEVAQSVWEDWVLLPDWFTLCWWKPIPMTSIKALQTTFYQLQCGQDQTGTSLWQFGPRESDMSCRRWGMLCQTREHLLLHCSQCKYQEQGLLLKMEKAMGWKADRCRHAEVSEQLAMAIYTMAVMDVQVGMDVVNAEAEWAMGAGVSSPSILLLWLWRLAAGTKGSWWELHHPTGSPRGIRNMGLWYSSYSKYSMNKLQQQPRHNITSWQQPTARVRNDSGPSLRVRVRVWPQPLPNCRSGLSINPNCQLW